MSFNYNSNKNPDENLEDLKEHIEEILDNPEEFPHSKDEINSLNDVLKNIDKIPIQKINKKSVQGFIEKYNSIDSPKNPANKTEVSSDEPTEDSVTQEEVRPDSSPDSPEFNTENGNNEKNDYVDIGNGYQGSGGIGEGLLDEFKEFFDNIEKTVKDYEARLSDLNEKELADYNDVKICLNAKSLIEINANDLHEHVTSVDEAKTYIELIDEKIKPQNNPILSEYVQPLYDYSKYYIKADETEKEISKKQDSIENNKEKIDEYDRIIGKINHQFDKRDLFSVDSSQTKLSVDDNALNERLEKALDRIESIQQNKSKYSDEIESLKNEVTILKSEIDTLKDKKENVSVINEKEKELEAKKAQIDVNKEKIQDCDKQISKIERNLIIPKDKKSEISKDDKQLKEWLDNLKDRIIEKKVDLVKNNDILKKEKADLQKDLKDEKDAIENKYSTKTKEPIEIENAKADILTSSVEKNNNPDKNTNEVTNDNKNNNIIIVDGKEIDTKFKPDLVANDFFDAFNHMRNTVRAYNAGVEVNGKVPRGVDVVVSVNRFLKSNLLESLITRGIGALIDILNDKDEKKDTVEAKGVEVNEKVNDTDLIFSNEIEPETMPSPDKDSPSDNNIVDSLDNKLSDVDNSDVKKDVEQFDSEKTVDKNDINNDTSEKKQDDASSEKNTKDLEHEKNEESVSSENKVDKDFKDNDDNIQVDTDKSVPDEIISLTDIENESLEETKQDFDGVNNLKIKDETDNNDHDADIVYSDADEESVINRVDNLIGETPKDIDDDNTVLSDKELYDKLGHINSVFDDDDELKIQDLGGKLSDDISDFIEESFNESTENHKEKTENPFSKNIENKIDNLSDQISKLKDVLSDSKNSIDNKNSIDKIKDFISDGFKNTIENILNGPINQIETYFNVIENLCDKLGLDNKEIFQDLRASFDELKFSFSDDASVEKINKFSENMFPSTESSPPEKVESPEGINCTSDGPFDVNGNPVSGFTDDTTQQAINDITAEVEPTTVTELGENLVDQESIRNAIEQGEAQQAQDVDQSKTTNNDIEQNVNANENVDYNISPDKNQNATDLEKPTENLDNNEELIDYSSVETDEAVDAVGEAGGEILLL